MFLIEIIKGMFFSGNGSAGTSNRDQAVMFTDKESANKYARDLSGSKVVEKRKK